MTRKVLILGASGGFGRAATRQFGRCGWQVTAMSRGGQPKNSSHWGESVTWVAGDLQDHQLTSRLAADADVVVHAVNVPYPKWNPLMIQHTQQIIELAHINNAHIMFVGNIYSQGIPENGVINEQTADAPINQLGQLRAELESMLAASTEEGLRCTVMRFGDFFGPEIHSPNWFNESVKGLNKHRLSLPGPAHLSHAWAYLPDAAMAMEQVAAERISNHDLPAYMELPFSGHQFSLSELRAILQNATGDTLKENRVPWWLFRTLGLVIPLFRELASTEYLWSHSIRLDDRALSELLDQPVHPTPLATAVCDTVGLDEHIASPLDTYGELAK